MTDLEKKKQEAIEIFNMDKGYFSNDELLDRLFDTGIRAERERVKQLLIDSSDFEFIYYLFPEETK